MPTAATRRSDTFRGGGSILGSRQRHAAPTHTHLDSKRQWRPAATTGRRHRHDLTTGTRSSCANVAGVKREEGVQPTTAAACSGSWYVCMYVLSTLDRCEARFYFRWTLRCLYSCILDSAPHSTRRQTKILSGRPWCVAVPVVQGLVTLQTTSRFTRTSPLNETRHGKDR